MGPYFLRSISRARHGMSSSTSYGIVHRDSTTFVMINAGFDDRVDVIIDMSPSHENPGSYSMKTMVYNEEIDNMLFNDDSPYKVFQLIYTSNNNESLVTSGYLAYSPCGQVLDYVMEEDDSKRLIWLAKFILYFERLHNDIPKAIKDVVKTRKLVKRKLEEEEKEECDQEICVICQEEYQEGHMIGVLPCKHSFHNKCIKKWLNKENKKRSCPTCRTNVFCFSE